MRGEPRRAQAAASCFSLSAISCRTSSGSRSMPSRSATAMVPRKVGSRRRVMSRSSRATSIWEPSAQARVSPLSSSVLARCCSQDSSAPEKVTVTVSLPRLETDLDSMFMVAVARWAGIEVVLLTSLHSIYIPDQNRVKPK